MKSIWLPLLAAVAVPSPSQARAPEPGGHGVAVAVASATIVPAVRTDWLRGSADTILDRSSARFHGGRTVRRIGPRGEIRYDLELQ